MGGASAFHVHSKKDDNVSEEEETSYGKVSILFNSNKNIGVVVSRLVVVVFHVGSRFSLWFPLFTLVPAFYFDSRFLLWFPLFTLVPAFHFGSRLLNTSNPAYLVSNSPFWFPVSILVLILVPGSHSGSHSGSRFPFW
jgi:hypothetical protein